MLVLLQIYILLVDKDKYAYAFAWVSNEYLYSLQNVKVSQNKTYWGCVLMFACCFGTIIIY